MSTTLESVKKHYNTYQHNYATGLSCGIHNTIMARWRPNGGTIKADLGFEDHTRPPLEQARIREIIEEFAKDGWIVKIRRNRGGDQQYLEVEVSRKVESA